MSIKVGAVSLGCDKNRVDTENMLAYVRRAGYEITSDEQEADIIIINTCAFIESSQKEAIDTILDFVAMKNQRDLKIIVTGCLSERYKQSLVESMPEVDAFLGIAQYSKIGEIIDKLTKGEKTVDFKPCDLPVIDRVLTTPYHYAYLKIADGCDNHCTYCAIPSIRGKYRSRTIDSLVDETKFLIDEYGIKELNVVAQDITRYGIDIYNEYSLMKLLDRLSSLNIDWIRLLYCYPELMTDSLIEFIVHNDKICKYVDIPLQHINDRILKLMNRHTDGKSVRALLDKLKTRDIAVRSSFIVGFPTETEAEFNELYDFIGEYRLNYAGFFEYSREDGTAADKLGGQLTKKIKCERQKKISALQSSIIFNDNKKYIGKTLKVLYEGIDYDKQMFYGRPEFCAPDVDTKVLFKSKTLTEIGNFYNVNIVGTDNYDLIGEVK